MNLELGPLKPEPVPLGLGLALFLLVLWVLGRHLLPRIERVQAERWEATEGRMERAEALQAEADAVQDAHLRELAEARHEAARIRADYAERGAAAIAAARAEGLRARDALLATGRAHIAADRATAADLLRQDVGELAIALAGRVIGEPVHDVAARRRTVARFFETNQPSQQDSSATSFR
ncbi:F0F1 ATP synthase subunit B [Kitasatospora sp. NPDC101447]|uniref:F0F1 ATP synthase subunit B family protein n=1 Tax=Kitasatospora sp. NPDC101447 TaxID=3364102 RepID=UPI00381C20C4